MGQAWINGLCDSWKKTSEAEANVFEFFDRRVISQATKNIRFITMNHLDQAQPLITFFENCSIALALANTDDDNHLVLVNDRFCELTGYSSDEVVGRNCRLLQFNPAGARASNDDARSKLRTFITGDETSVRTPIVNFKKDGTPFINLLFMSKLKAQSGTIRYIFASQFDVSRTYPHLLEDYDLALGKAIKNLKPLLDGHNVILEGTLATIANSTTTIAQAKLTLAELEQNEPY